MNVYASIYGDEENLDTYIDIVYEQSNTTQYHSQTSGHETMVYREGSVANNGEDYLSAEQCEELI